jgi:hypothetical protein
MTIIKHKRIQICDIRQTLFGHGKKLGKCYIVRIQNKVKVY